MLSNLGLKKRYNIHNPFRKVYEFKSVAVLSTIALVGYTGGKYLFFSPMLQVTFVGGLSLMALLRLKQGLNLSRYQRQIRKLKRFTMNIKDTVQLKDSLFTGLGFRWTVKHADLMYRLNLTDNAHLLQDSKLTQKVQAYKSDPSRQSNRFMRYLSQDKFNPFQPPPPVGGVPAMHGIEREEYPIGILESERTGHCFIFGSTRSGKTRMLCILTAQDILRGKSVVIIDPKGDLDYLRSIYSVCESCNRLGDLQVVHLGFPDVSAKMNTLASFVEVIDVAGRITASLSTDGGSDAFVKFAWRFINICARTLHELGETINYRLINFFLLKPEALLMRYVVKKHPDVIEEANRMIDEDFKKQLENEKTKASAQKKDLQWGVVKALTALQQNLMQTDKINDHLDSLLFDLIDLVNLDNYQKLAQSAKPTLEMLSTGRSAEIFSFMGSQPQGEVILSHLIKSNGILYIGLNSMVNKEVSQAAGQAILADLIQSCAGKTYNLGEKNTCAIYIDEVSEIVQDDLIRLLNKAGGAGFQVTGALQTSDDLEAGLDSKTKAYIAIGNTQSKIFMRVRNTQTAELLTTTVREVHVDSVTQDSSANDTPYADEDVFYKSTQRSSLGKEKLPLISAADLINLPKGQFFMDTNGNELYKGRCPEPKGEDEANADFEDLIRSVNEIHERLRQQKKFEKIKAGV